MTVDDDGKGLYTTGLGHGDALHVSDLDPFRKGLEVVYTFIIEKVWGKDVILARYLNSIEMGQGVFGVEAASNYYFGKSAKDLTKSEAAWIAVVLPNPKKYDPKNPTPYLRKKHNWVMRQMNNIVLK